MMSYYILTKQIHNVQCLNNYSCEYEVYHLNVDINDYQNAVRMSVLYYKKISNQIYLNMRLQFLQYKQKDQNIINNIYNEFVLTALLMLINVILNVLVYIKSIMLINDKIQNLSDTVVLNYKFVMMYNYNSQLYNFRDVDSILMIENVVF